jgi:photosystem II stability/assembly factor-like uncharacterized protein
MSSPRRIMTLAFTIVMAAMLASCESGGAAHPAASEASPTTPIVTSPPVPSSSTAPTQQQDNQEQTDAPNPSPNQIQTKLTDFQLFDSKTGFAWGTTSDVIRMYKTVDGGMNWSAFTPSGESLRMGSPKKGHSLFFLDAQHGWIGTFKDVEPSAIVATTNGGSSWRRTALNKSTFPAGMAFVDAEKGWLITSSDAAMGSSEKTLYTTTNGGAAWTPLTSTSIDGSVESKHTGALPRSGSPVGISFKDKNNGWIPFAGHEEKPILYRTKNGGTTWSQVALTIPKERANFTMYIEEAPIFFPGDAQHGWMPVRSHDDKQEYMDAYVTSDGGETWTLKPFGMQPVLTFLNPQQGWAFKDRVLYRTANAGESWSPIQVNGTLTDKLKTYPVPLELQFITPQTGCLLLGSAQGDKSILLKTEDRGSSWSIL